MFNQRKATKNPKHKTYEVSNGIKKISKNTKKDYKEEISEQAPANLNFTKQT